MNQSAGLRTIVAYKLVRGSLSIALAIVAAATALSGHATGLRVLAESVREHVVGNWAVRVVELLVQAATPRHLEILSLALLADGTFAIFEGWALGRGFRWAPWLVVLATAALLPIELYEIVRRVRVGRVVVFIANLMIVAYLYLRELRAKQQPNA